MSLDSLRRFDLNLLLIFHALMDTRSVSRAAQALGMSQPAVSAALARLRQAVGDALFVRCGRSGMQPTPLAEQMAGPVADALAGISHSMRVRADFDPARSQRQFTIAMLDAAEAHFMPALVAHCQRHAPGIGIAVQTPLQAAGGVQAALLQGTVDLAIGAFEDMPQGALQQLLFEQPFVLLARSGHPALPDAATPGPGPDPARSRAARAVQPRPLGHWLAQQPQLDAACLAGAACALLQQPQGVYAQAQQALLALAGSANRRQRRGADVTVQAAAGAKQGAEPAHYRCASLLTLPLLVAQSDAVALVPAQLARTFSAVLPLRAWQLRLGRQAPVLRTYCFWHPRFHRDEGTRWLRNMLFALFAQPAPAARIARRPPK
ncbi:LysR family transcriptional regulator [Comamonadaceae bacterium OH2310_COT-174]|nr:LysR family transcriptional regulator [Comamonadaceae bacterium OH2310_COT-174]